MASELWQELLNDVRTAEAPAQTPQQNIIPTQSPVPFSTPELALYSQEQVNRIQNPPTGIQPSVFVGGTTEIIDELVDESSDEDDELMDELTDDSEDGIDDAPIENNFSLSLPEVKPANLDFSLSLGTPTPIKPKPQGRPPQVNTANAVLQDINKAVVAQDLSKSGQNTQQQVAQTKQKTTEVTVTIPKKTLIEIGQSLERIARAFLELGQ